MKEHEGGGCSTEIVLMLNTSQQFLSLFGLFGRIPAGRAIRCKSSLVPHCGLFTAIPYAAGISPQR